MKNLRGKEFKYKRPKFSFELSNLYKDGGYNYSYILGYFINLNNSKIPCWWCIETGENSINSDYDFITKN